MPELFTWNPQEDQSYSFPGSIEITGSTFDKDPGKGFSMDAPAGTLKLLCSESSEWGGAIDAQLPPSEITISGQSTLIMQASSSDSTGVVDFSMGPRIPEAMFHPLVEFVISDSSFEAKNFNTVNAGGVSPLVRGMPIDQNLKLTLEGSSLYHVYCLAYYSTKILEVTGSSAVKVRANEILLTYSTYTVSPKSLPKLLSDNFSLSMESTIGTMTLAETTMTFKGVARGKLKSNNIILRENVEIDVEDDASVTLATDLVTFFDAATTAKFSIANSANIIFDTYYGNAPFDFMNRTYPMGLFNLITPCTGKITLYGIGNAFSKVAMLNQQIVAVDGVAQSDEKKVNFEYVGGEGGTQNMVLSLK